MSDSRFDGLLEPASKDGMASLTEAALISLAISMKRIADTLGGTVAESPSQTENNKGSAAHQIEMAVVRTTLRNAVIPPALACGIDCDCTANCERDFFPEENPT